MWKPIYSFEDKYMINENGEVYSITKNKIVKPYITNKGYYMIDLFRDGIRYHYLVHRLVAETFIPNPNNFPVVMHIDNNRLNPNVNNLKWGTYSDNSKQAVSEGRVIVPIPDNRKKYSLYNDEVGIEFICNGLQEIIDMNKIGTDTMFRNYVTRNTPITKGIFKGWKIKRENVQRLSPDGRVKP